MLGAIVGDIVGSRFEFANFPTDGTECDFGVPVAPGFELFAGDCKCTDDTILTLAVCRALLDSLNQPSNLPQLAVERFVEFGRAWPLAGYGGRFEAWLRSREHVPYNSMGNGSAMRVSGCAYAAETLEEALFLADQVTAVTHNHPEGMKGARAVTAATFLARKGKDKESIRRHIVENYYSLDFTLDEIRPSCWKEQGIGLCGKSVPQALQAFFESTDFESAIRLAVSIGGDTDTLGAIAGAPAGAFYHVPESIAQEALAFLPEELRSVLEAFEAAFPT